jgi:hypothetical protein
MELAQDRDRWRTLVSTLYIYICVCVCVCVIQTCEHIHAYIHTRIRTLHTCIHTYVRTLHRYIKYNVKRENRVRLNFPIHVLKRITVKAIFSSWLNCVATVLMNFAHYKQRTSLAFWEHVV